MADDPDSHGPDPATGNGRRNIAAPGPPEALILLVRLLARRSARAAFAREGVERESPNEH